MTMEDNLKKESVQPLLADPAPQTSPPSETQSQSPPSSQGYNQQGYNQQGYGQSPYGPPQGQWGPPGGYGTVGGQWGSPPSSPVININQSSNNENSNVNNAGGGGPLMMGGGDATCFHITSAICALLSIFFSPLLMLIPMCMLCCCCGQMRSPLDANSGARQLNYICTVIMVILWSIAIVIIAIPTLGIGLVGFVFLIPSFIVLHALSSTRSVMMGMPMWR